jgi:SAM-dependent methyltransferase
MSHPDPDEHTRRLAAETDDPTGWFERLYVQARDGEAVVPWDRGQPHPVLVRWAEQQALTGDGRPAMVVGCGMGQDAEYVARLGFETVGFDISETAVQTVRTRFPDSGVRYVVADLLDPPDEWLRAFDLVVETFTVQSMPESLHKPATANVGQLVAPGGTLIVIAVPRDEGARVEGPPWPLTRAEVEAFADGDLEAVRIDLVEGRWRAEFRRRRRLHVGG